MLFFFKLLKLGQQRRYQEYDLVLEDDFHCKRTPYYYIFAHLFN